MFKEIADYLLNIDKEKATGLLVGNAGVSLFLYQVYRKTGQTEFEETADILLNNIFLHTVKYVIDEFIYDSRAALVSV